MNSVVADRAAEDRVGQRTLVVVEPDEVGQRLEAVPVVQAVAGRLDDREQDEDGVERPAPAAGTARPSCQLRRSATRRPGSRARTMRVIGPSRNGEWAGVTAGPFRLDRRESAYWAGGVALMASATSSGVAVPAYRVGDRVVDRRAELRRGRLVEVELRRTWPWPRPSSTDVRFGSVTDASEPTVVGRMPSLRAPQRLADVDADEELQEVDRLGRRVLADGEAVAAADAVGRGAGATRRRPGTGTSRGPRRCPLLAL